MRKAENVVNRFVAHIQSGQCAFEKGFTSVSAIAVSQVVFCLTVRFRKHGPRHYKSRLLTACVAGCPAHPKPRQHVGNRPARGRVQSNILLLIPHLDQLAHNHCRRHAGVYSLRIRNIFQGTAGGIFLEQLQDDLLTRHVSGIPELVVAGVCPSSGYRLRRRWKETFFARHGVVFCASSTKEPLCTGTRGP